MKTEKEEALLDRRKKLVKVQEKTISEEERVASRQAKLEAKESSEWEAEYEKFKATNLFDDFEDIVQSITRHRSQVRALSMEGHVRFQIDEDLLAYAYGNGLLNIVGSGKDEIELTEKGKHFLARFQLDSATQAVS